MKKLVLEVQEDVFDKVLSFLELLPKEKIKITTSISKKIKENDTEYLLSNPVNHKRLLESIEQLKTKDCQKRELIEE